MTKSLAFLFAMLLPALALSAPCKEIPAGTPDLKLSLWADGLDKPVSITHAGDGSGALYVVEQAGVIRRLFKGVVQKEPFLDIRARVIDGGERGLLGLAFHPDYRSNGRLYVDYTAQEGRLTSIIAEFTVRNGRVDAASERRLLTVAQPYGNHNGGQLAFGPDGYLYIALGDGGSANDPRNNAQNLGTLLGKILRIDVDRREAQLPYAIPADNPFRTTAMARPEIWAYGLRNPWRFSFDRLTGELYAADVGQDEVEEIDIIQRGRNYGWRIMEGPQCTPGVNRQCDDRGFEPPLHSYTHAQGRSITGGYVYRGNTLPELCGVYVYGDFVSQAIWGLRQRGGKAVAHYTIRPSRSALRLAVDYFADDGLLISTFGEDEAGELYVAAYQSGRLYTLVRR